MSLLACRYETNRESKIFQKAERILNLSDAGKPAKEVIGDEKWYQDTFIPLIQARDAFSHNLNIGRG